MSKKLTYLCSFVFVLVAIPSVTFAQFENLVSNPSFEEDEDILADDGEQWAIWAWDVSGNTTLEFDESTYVDGIRSLRINPVEGGADWWFILYQPIEAGFEVGETYTLSFWAKSEEPRPLTAMFRQSGGDAWGSTIFQLTTEWAEYSLTAAIPLAEGNIEFFCADSEVPFWLDYFFAYEGEYIPGFTPGGAVKATAPSPADGAVDVSRDIILSWTSGKYAEKHELYFGTDINDVNNADVNDTTGIYQGSLELDVTSYTPTEMPLQWGQTYSWRIDEVNDTEPNSPWKGGVWSFTIINHIVVEDFEDYNDYSPNEVWNTWIDGYDDPTNGASAGYPAPDFVLGEHYLEDNIVHGGDWSLPLIYSNGLSGLSEVTRTLTSDWTQEDVITLTLFYIGNLGNAAEPMYVALNGDAVVTNDNPSAALESDWTQWDILLQDFADMGVDLTDVDTLSIGFGNKANPTPGGGDGRVFFDDIRLYRSPPVPPIDHEPEPEPVDPGTDNLVASYSFENNIQDGSGNGLNGTIVGNPGFVEGITGMGLLFDGVNDYVDLGDNEAFDITEQITLSAWVNTNDSGNSQHNPYLSKGDHAYAIKHSSSNQMEFFIYDDDNWFLASARVDDSFNGMWHHVAGTYDGMELKLYVDGSVGATVEHEGSIEIQTHHLNIARNSEEVHRTYDGVIDEVRIYDRALSWAEILFIVDN